MTAPQDAAASRERGARAREPIYGAPLARIHAEHFAPNLAPAFPWLIDLIRENAPQPRLFDLGCGDGLWMEAARAAGIATSGIDASADFVALARARGLDVACDTAASALPPPNTTAVTALGEVLAYAPAALAPCARNMARALASGSLMVFDLPGPDAPEGDLEMAGDDWRLSVRTRRRDGLLIRRIQVETRAGISRETHRQRLFSPDEAAGIVRGFGLAPEILESYGPCPLLPGRFALLARVP